MGMMINRRRVCGGKLPYDAEIEYLESSGTQYIDTGLKSSKNVFVFDFVASCANTSTQNRIIIGAVSGFNVSVVGSKYRATSRCVSTIDANIDTPVHIIMTSNSLSDSILLKIDESTFSGTYGSFVYYTNIGLFGAGDGSYESSSIIYSAAIYKNNVKIADFIPVRVGTTGYMYDKVSGQLFGNAGTGDFILGPDK